MNIYLPYIASILCALISGFASYAKTRKQVKVDIRKLQKQYELDMEKEREKFVMEKARMEMDHKNQLELNQAQSGNKLIADMISTMTKEYLHSPTGQAQMRTASSKKRH
ncbi:MAG: hypothetical protein ACYC5K_05410 [Saccharofermentanales bacterium]